MSEKSINSAISRLSGKMLKKYITSIKIEGFLLLILGSIAIIAPFLFARVLESFLGALFIMVGVFGLIGTFSVKIIPSSFFSFLLYILFIGTGIIIFKHPYSGMNTFAFIIGVFFVVSGFFKFAFALSMKPAKNWFWALIDGLITIFLGGIIFAQWPISGIVVISIMVGIKLIFLGYSLIMLSSGIKYINSQKIDLDS